MADDPFRLRVLKGLTAVLEAVQVPDDAEPLTGKVFRGRSLYGAGDPLPLISILEAPAPAEQFGVPISSPAGFGPWELVIQGWTKDDKKNPTDPAHVLMAAVKKQLAIEKKKLIPNSQADVFGMGRAITNITVSPGVVRPPDDVSDKAYFWLSLTVEMAENLEDPYA